MRAVMVKLKKKRGIDVNSVKRRRPIRTASDMTKDEAALAIQKSEKRYFLLGDLIVEVTISLSLFVTRMLEGYRGYSVRKEYGCAPGKPKRFECVTIQEEAANTIQYFYRKWKGKTIYQQLLLYRAAKQQELTYFCQQVSTDIPLIRFAFFFK
jgi:hypothetical protein